MRELSHETGFGARGGVFVDDPFGCCLIEPSHDQRQQLQCLSRLLLSEQDAHAFLERLEL